MVLGICCFLVIRKITRKRSRHRILNRDGDEEVDEATGARIQSSSVVIPSRIYMPTAYTLEDLDDKPSAQKGIPIARITDTNLVPVSNEISEIAEGEPFQESVDQVVDDNLPSPS